MLFAIHALDHADGLPKRLSAQAAHSAYLKDASAHGVKIVVSGPLTTDDGETMIGSLIVVEAPDRASVEKFNENDPYNKAGVWKERTITAFLKRTDNR